jgi:hypothetical protein
MRSKGRQSFRLAGFVIQLKRLFAGDNSLVIENWQRIEAI